MLSSTCKYAVRACIYLAINADENKKIGIKKISEDLGIPTPFLGKIMQVLAKNKLLASTKGPNGGFSLGKPSKKITLMDIVLIIDGIDEFESCVIGLVSCKTGEAHCPIHKTYSPIRDEAKALFMRMDLDELAGHVRDNHDSVMV
jgi:Rrf2 family transcriptional regulator, iron-sulfur cluster assembly transcription factor